MKMITALKFKTFGLLLSVPLGVVLLVGCGRPADNAATATKGVSLAKMSPEQLAELDSIATQIPLRSVPANVQVVLDKYPNQGGQLRGVRWTYGRIAHLYNVAVSSGNSHVQDYYNYVKGQICTRRPNSAACKA